MPASLAAPAGATELAGFGQAVRRPETFGMVRVLY